MSGERVERRLAAILAADIAGYSRLMGADEEGTLRGLKTLRAALFDPKVAEHRGRIVKTTGDGALVEFQSVVDAVRFAVEVQRDDGASATPAYRRTSASSSASASITATSSSTRTTSSATGSISPRASKASPSRAASASAGSCAIEVRDKLDFAFADIGEQKPEEHRPAGARLPCRRG